MQYRRLGTTELHLSEIGFSIWGTGSNWTGNSDLSYNVTLLQQAAGLGINFFDASDKFAEGLGTQILAKALRHQRHDLVISTKYECEVCSRRPMEECCNHNHDISPQLMRQACERTLRHLTTDYIDLYQICKPRAMPLQNNEVTETLEDLVREGKIRYFGVVLCPDLNWFEEGVPSIRRSEAASVQLTYNILDQEPAYSFFDIAKQEQVGLLGRFPHGSSNNIRGQTYLEPTVDIAKHKHRETEEIQRRADQILNLTEHHDFTLAQTAIRFVLAKQTISSVLTNPSSINELREYTTASDLEDLCTQDLDSLYAMYQKGLHYESD